METAHRAIPQCAFSHYTAAFANDPYEVKRFLKKGGTESVYLAQDALLDKKWLSLVLKCLVGAYPLESPEWTRTGAISASTLA